MHCNLFGFEESLGVELGIHLVARQGDDPPLTHMITPAATVHIHILLDLTLHVHTEFILACTVIATCT